MGKEYRVRCKRLDAEGRGVVTFNGREFAVKGLLPGELATIELVYRVNGGKALPGAGALKGARRACLPGIRALRRLPASPHERKGTGGV